MLTLSTVLLIVNVLVYISLSFVIFSSGKSRSDSARYFSYLLAVLMFWSITNYFCDHPFNSEWALFWNRLTFAIASLQFPFFLFAWSFPKETSVFPKVVKNTVVIFATVIALLSLLTPFIIASVQTYDWGSNPTPGLLYPLFLVDILGSFGGGFWILLRKMKLVYGREKNQLFYIFAGVSITILSFLFIGVLLPHYSGFTKYSQFIGLCSIPFTALTTYSIIKYRMFNIKVVLTEIAIGVIAIALLVQAIMTGDTTGRIVNWTVFAIVVYGSYILIKAELSDIKHTEEVERLATKLNNANEDLNAANEHLKELDEAKDNFISMASHELNTPIAAIEGYLSMIVEEKMCGSLNEKMERYLGNVFVSSKRLAALVKDLLNVSRIESNRIHILYAEAKIEDLIDQAVAEIAIKAKNEGHEIVWHRPETNLPKTYLDVARIIEVLINLLGNALKYTDPPGKIVIESHADDGKIVVSVSDNGRGIPKDKEDHIFEKFVQVDTLKDEVKGTGLGMFISKNLIELHNGKLWFKSSVEPENHGTTFYFSVPILKSKPFDRFEGQGAVIALK